MTLTNVPASVHARLMNRARAEHRPYQELLHYFAIERFLYRLSKSRHRSRFVLKGALMLHVWRAPIARATKDVDLLGQLDNSLELLAELAREVCVVDVDPDGMRFDPASVQAERIKEDADYEGVRVRFVGFLARSRVAMQIDVGFGDVVTPDVEVIEYPTLLEFPSPTLSGYPRETVVAEKFHAMVYLGTTNSRMKDFYDVWLLARTFPFDGAVLVRAVTATFAQRKTVVDPSPVAFSSEYANQPSTSAQWAAFRKRLAGADVPETLDDVIGVVSAFILPVARACAEAELYTRVWSAGVWSSR